MISCIIPTYKDEGYLERCLASVKAAVACCGEEVEILIMHNTPDIGKPLACYYAARVNARGETLVLLDADCVVSKDFFCEVSEEHQRQE